MKAIEILEGEHGRLERAISELIARLAKATPIDIARGLDAVEGVMDRLHLPRLEALVNMLLSDSLDLAALGPIQVLRREHELARAYLRSARSALAGVGNDGGSERDRLSRAVRAYADLMRAYLPKERVLFRLAQRTLDAARDAELVARFERIEAEVQIKLNSVVTAQQVPPVDARTLAAEASGVADSEEAELMTSFHAKAGGVLHEDEHHQSLWLHDFGRGLAVQANVFLIIDHGQGMILDPGGPKVYPDVFAETSLRLGRTGALRYIFLSHQDPDVCTSLNAWMMDTEAVAYVSRLWVRFLPHFGIDKLLEHRMIGIPDEGLTLELGGCELTLVPAHFLHSPGNFQVYDATSRILFTGDLGGALGSEDTMVSNFDAHIEQMLPFHQRYMASRKALEAWVERVSYLDIETIAPQHGPIFRGRPMVKKLLDWLSSLECGVDLI